MTNGLKGREYVYRQHPVASSFKSIKEFSAGDRMDFGKPEAMESSAEIGKGMSIY